MNPKRLLRQWKVKAVLQKVISALPRAERVNYLFQRYATGTARRTDDWYRTNIGQAEQHLENWRAASGNEDLPRSALELGTGWHVTVPLCLALWGVEVVRTVDRTSLLDPERLADGALLLAELLKGDAGSPPRDEARFRRLLYFAERGRIEIAELAEIGVHVHLGDARHLADKFQPIELFTSNNVLEHVGEAVLPEIFRRYRELAAEVAVMSHFVDLADHFSAFDPSISSRNFLRYSDAAWRRWDNNLVPQNRLLISDYRRAIADAGFMMVSEQLTRDQSDAVRAVPLAPRYLRYSTEELSVETAWLVSRPNLSQMTSGPLGEVRKLEH